jgi:hypothetical protein
MPARRRAPGIPKHRATAMRGVLMAAADNPCEHVCGNERQVGNGTFPVVAKFKIFAMRA